MSIFLVTHFVSVLDGPDGKNQESAGLRAFLLAANPRYLHLHRNRTDPWIPRPKAHWPRGAENQGRGLPDSPDELRRV